MSTNPKPRQFKFGTEAEARSFARTLGTAWCIIIRSIEGGWPPTPDAATVYYLETPHECGFIRSWEAAVYSGEGRRA